MDIDLQLSEEFDSLKFDVREALNKVEEILIDFENEVGGGRLDHYWLWLEDLREDYPK